jgi:predicted  nucleic acid-binding Zn-ribbon protein
MAGPATILREIHRLQKNKADLKAEIERIPHLTRLQQAKVARQEEALREAHEALKRFKLNSHDKESQLKSMLQQVTKHEDQLNQAGSKKEYDALKVEIASDKKKAKELEDQILEAMGQIEEKTSQIPEAEKGVKQAKQEYADFEKSIAERRDNLSKQLEDILQQLAAVESTLPPDVRPPYDRQVAARGEDAMAAVQNRTCMACYTEITNQAYNDLMLSQFVLCKSCGRVLYLPE